jgi:hypothetical protein
LAVTGVNLTPLLLGSGTLIGVGSLMLLSARRLRRSRARLQHAHVGPWAAGPSRDS